MTAHEASLVLIGQLAAVLDPPPELMARSIQSQESWLHLWLRIAGTAWIAIEWAAAYYLWRGYRLARRFFEHKDQSHD